MYTFTLGFRQHIRQYSTRGKFRPVYMCLIPFYRLLFTTDVCPLQYRPRTRYSDCCNYCMTSDKLSILHLGVLAMTRLCQTLLNHYYGNWFYVLPYRLLYIVQLWVFTHDCSVLLTVSPPPSRQIYTRRPWGKKERRREGLRNTSL